MTREELFNIANQKHMQKEEAELKRLQEEQWDKYIFPIILNAANEGEFEVTIRFTYTDLLKMRIANTDQLKKLIEKNDFSYQIDIDKKKLIYDITISWNKKSNPERNKLTAGLRYDILKRDNFKCQICGRSAEDGVKLHVDHIIPICKGGKTTWDNLRTLCQDCNLGKGSKLEI